MQTKILTIGSLISLMFIFTQCIQPEGLNDAEVITSGGMPNDEIHSGIDNIGNVIGGGSSTIDEFSERGATAVATSITDVGIKDFEQIHMSMSVLTGINPSNENSIRNAYEDLKTSLPNDHSVKMFNSTIQFSIFKLATEYCNVMLDNANYYNTVFTSVNMTEGIKNDVSRQDAVINDLINRFWGGAQVQDAALLTATRADLKALLGELIADEDNNGAASRKVAKGLCAAMLSTPQVTML